MGTPGRGARTHGLLTAAQIRKASVPGYESGLRHGRRRSRVKDEAAESRFESSSCVLLLDAPVGSQHTPHRFGFCFCFCEGRPRLLVWCVHSDVRRPTAHHSRMSLGRGVVLAVCVAMRVHLHPRRCVCPPSVLGAQSFAAGGRSLRTPPCPTGSAAHVRGGAGGDSN